MRLCMALLLPYPAIQEAALSVIEHATSFTPTLLLLLLARVCDHTNNRISEVVKEYLMNSTSGLKSQKQELQALGNSSSGTCLVCDTYMASFAPEI